ncbi:cysteine synthase-like protein, partial [Tanacetum coccineum]
GESRPNLVVDDFQSRDKDDGSIEQARTVPVKFSELVEHKECKDESGVGSPPENVVNKGTCQPIKLKCHLFVAAIEQGAEMQAANVQGTWNLGQASSICVSFRGIGLALVAATRGYMLFLVMPSTYSLERIIVIRAFAAELCITDISKGIDGVLIKVNELPETTPNSYFLKQFENLANPKVSFGGVKFSMGHSKNKPKAAQNGIEHAESAILNGGSIGKVLDTSHALTNNGSSPMIVVVQGLV